MRFYFAKSDCYVSDNFQELHGKDVDIPCCAVCNSLLTPLFAELSGRTPFGGGLLKVQTYEVERLLVLNPRSLEDAQAKQLRSTFNQVSGREIHSLFEELGLSKPNRDYSNIDPNDVSLDKVLPDRRAMDEVVFEALGLTEEEQLEVYRAVVELVKNRLVKARSV
jgi:hypothetical protein